METILFIIALLTCIYLLFTIMEFTLGFKKIVNLTNQAALESNKLPSISIIFSALNEEKDIAKALTSLLELNYPQLEIIAINDRSTDKTPEILERFHKEYPTRLRVLHINHLPDGWLGKNHALYFGSQHAKGEWLLFTDADVLMKSDTLTKAMSYVLKNNLDHLTIYENHLRKYFWLKVFYLGHYVTYCMAFKPWRIRYSWSKKYLGHGAFNLINKKSYQQCGGHQAISMECLDDLKFGKLIKEHGFNQDTVDGRDFIEKEWYKSLSDMIHGLKKNSFAFFEYKILPTVIAIIFALLFYIWPLFGAIIFSGPIRWLNIANIFFTFYMSASVAIQFRLKKRYALLYPASITILLYTMLNSVISVYKNKGVIWRGTHYSLKELKK